ncbi:MAG: hypothetical protein K8R02_04320 [Anaerohalosphaeraceae bacterium]|nr:hypothetical protein [Anaerohalosphaeraceae bacterium]
MAKLRLTDQKGSLDMLIAFFIFGASFYCLILLLFKFPISNILDKPRDVGELVSIKIEKASLLDRVTSTVDTTKGTFCVYGCVSGTKGATVTIRRRKNQLCINKACYAVFKFQLSDLR